MHVWLLVLIKMKKLFLVSLFWLLIVNDVAAQAKLIQKVDPIPGVKNPFSIPFSKYKLKNGLTLIVMEDHSDPLVHVNVTYHVGSAREELGKSGFAHFFEHMMFQGSKDVANEQHFKIVTEAGGTMNGSTNRDRTNYFETVPANYLERVLWLESDRMGFLLDSVTQHKFEIQRATVKNEKGQRYENRPYGMAGEVSDRCFYPYAHPYAWPTIGYVDDLNRVGVDDLKKFFLRWYGPNNAVLTIGGDVNTDDVVKLVEKYFGTIPSCPEVSKPTLKYFIIDRDRYISYADNVKLPMLKIMFPGVPAYSEDEAALDVIAEILGGGKSSILYKDFVKAQKAVSATADNSSDEISGQFSLTVRANAGTKLSETEKDLRAALDSFEKRGITDEDLKKAIARRKSETIYQLESVSNKVTMLAEYETFMGNSDYLLKDVSRYAGLKKGDIMRVYEKYIKNDHALILSIYPKDKKELIAAPDNYAPSNDTIKDDYRRMMQYDTLKVRPVADNFDRSKMPPAGPAPKVAVPDYYSETLPNGIRIIGTRNPEVPDLYMQMSVKCGQWRQPAGKEGVANLMAKMLKEATRVRSAEQMEDELDEIGSSINININEEDMVVSVKTLTENLTKTLELLKQTLAMPKFDEEDFERVKKQTLQGIASQSVQADAMANEAFGKLLYGDGTPMGIPITGTAGSVKNITLDDVKEYYKKYFIPTSSILSVSGDMTMDELRGQLVTLMGWRPAQADTIKVVQYPVAPATKIYLVNKPGAPQSEIRVGYLAMPYDATGDFYKANVMNYVLGSAFNSRLNLDLREKKGYTYGIRSSFSGFHFPGPFTVSAGVRGNVTDSSVYQIMQELQLYREKGITKQELEFTKKAFVDREALQFETNAQKASYLKGIDEYDLPMDYIARQNKILKKLNVKEIDKIAKTYLPLQNVYIVVVGDKDKIKDGLDKIGCGPVFDYSIEEK